VFAYLHITPQLAIWIFVWSCEVFVVRFKVSSQLEYVKRREEESNLRSHDRTHNPHNPITRNGNPIPRASVSRRQNLRCISIQRSIIDILASQSASRSHSFPPALPPTSHPKKLTKKKLIQHVKAKFCALSLTCVYAKKKAMVISAPMIIVPLLPQKNLLLHIKPARIGEGIEQRLAMA
jgi:hypothetical protein